MKFKVFLDGAFHEELDSPPGDYTGLEECHCTEDTQCHTFRIFELIGHEVTYELGAKPYVKCNYVSRCALPIVETMQ